MNKHFMIDIETTGIQPELHDLLQIGVLEVDYDDQYKQWRPGRVLEILQRHTSAPASEFAKAKMAKIYERCAQSPGFNFEQIRFMLLEFFKSCGAVTRNDVKLMGWNASSFDIPFLVEKGCLIAPGYETVDGKDVEVGDFNYRVYEISGSLGLTCDVLGVERQELVNIIENEPIPQPPAILCGRDEHDAIYDCYKQLNFLNALIVKCRYSS